MSSRARLSRKGLSGRASSSGASGHRRRRRCVVQRLPLRKSGGWPTSSSARSRNVWDQLAQPAQRRGSKSRLVSWPPKPQNGASSTPFGAATARTRSTRSGQPPGRRRPGADRQGPRSGPSPERCRAGADRQSPRSAGGPRAGADRQGPRSAAGPRAVAGRRGRRIAAGRRGRRSAAGRQGRLHRPSAHVLTPLRRSHHLRRHAALRTALGTGHVHTVRMSISRCGCSAARVRKSVYYSKIHELNGSASFGNEQRCSQTRK